VAARSQVIKVSFMNIGSGKVVLDLPAEDLVTPQPRQQPPLLVSTPNIRLADGIAQTRLGYEAVGTAPDANRITGTFAALFDDGTVHTMRFTKNKVYSWQSAWVDRTPAAGAPSGDDDDYWSMAMVPRTGAVSPKNMLMAVNGVDNPLVWNPDDTDALWNDAVDTTEAGPVGGKVVVSAANRAVVMNVRDASAERKQARVQWSEFGDAISWTSSTSGFADLLDDPYAITAASPILGGIAILKGDANGGALWRATPTGLPYAPLRFDAVNPGKGVGILLPRTLISLNPNKLFFVGHDGLYFYDGAAALNMVAPEVTHTIMNSINQEALNAAVAWYKPRSHEIFIGIPEGGSTTVTSVWVFNHLENRVYGPMSYADVITAANTLVSTDTLTWQDAESAPYDDDTWEDFPFLRWADVALAAGANTVALATSTGILMNDSDSQGATDNGATITGQINFPPITAEGRAIIAGGRPIRELEDTDELTLHDVHIRYRSEFAWTPFIEYRTGDTAAWIAITTGVELPAGAAARLTSKTYSLDPGGVTSDWFEFRISGIDMRLHDFTAEFTYGGDSRTG